MNVIHKQPPIIIIKKAAHTRHPHHGGAWKVAYADFVTAMMAFFMVMWLVNASPKVKTSVASYFREPGVFQTTAGSVLPAGSSGSVPDALGGHDPGSGSAQALEQTASAIRETLAEIPAFAQLKDRVEVTVTSEGLRIELLDTRDESFFRIGSADLQPETVQLLQTITKELAGLPNKIAIEGHTDSRPYGPDHGYGNWELSSDRARAARIVMEDAALDPSRVEALHAYADARLRHPDDPFDARNRRIAIVVKQQS